jgi:CRP-like cAMP-binding protein
MAVSPPLRGNDLIERLPGPERRRLLGLCRAVDLLPGSILCDVDQTMSHAYFPSSGSISLVSVLGPRTLLEVGLIGREGMLGSTLALGVPAAQLRAIVQDGGRAQRLSATALRRALPDSPVLLRTLHRYEYVLLKQLLLAAACIHFHEIGPRLARCLLMTHDRVLGDHFHLTHSLLAATLGVRRSGVTIAAGVLQADRLIRYTRGDISVLDRVGLEDAACDCYSAMSRVYRHGFGTGNPA